MVASSSSLPWPSVILFTIVVLTRPWGTVVGTTAYGLPQSTPTTTTTKQQMGRGGSSPWVSPWWYWWSGSRRRETSRLFVGVEPHDTVPFSSRQMAAVRALEAERPDRLFNDTISEYLAGSEAMRQGRERFGRELNRSQGVGRKIAVRTKYFDDFILAQCQRGASQVVIVGAGMDTRAYRLEFPPETAVFEVDTAAVVNSKEALLKALGANPTVQRWVTLGVDLESNDTTTTTITGHQNSSWLDLLRTKGLEDKPTVVVMEGLLMYLDPASVVHLLKTIGQSFIPGSWVGISLVDTRSLADAQASDSPLRQSWKWGCDERDVKRFFQSSLGPGWRVRYVVKVGDEGGYPKGANYGCWPQDRVKTWRRKGKTLYVVAEKKKARSWWRLW